MAVEDFLCEVKKVDEALLCGKIGVNGNDGIIQTALQYNV